MSTGAGLACDSVVCVAGDWHGAALAAVSRIEYAANRDAEVIVHAGDFGLAHPRYADRFVGAVGRALTRAGLALLLVPGNHDDWSLIDGLPLVDCRLQKYTNRIYIVPRAHRWEWAGSTWMGLSGAVSVDRHRLVPGRTWWPQEAMTDADVDAAVDGGRPVDVVVSHDVPSSVEVPGTAGQTRWPADALRDSAAHRDRLQRVAVRVRPRVWLHGHHHRRYTTRVDLGLDKRRPDRTGTMTVYGLADHRASVRDNMVFVHPNGDLVGE